MPQGSPLTSFHLCLPFPFLLLFPFARVFSYLPVRVASESADKYGESTFLSGQCLNLSCMNDALTACSTDQSNTFPPDIDYFSVEIAVRCCGADSVVCYQRLIINGRGLSFLNPAPHQLLISCKL